MHITDIHIDPHYRPDSSHATGCHRPKSNDGDDSDSDNNDNDNNLISINSKSKKIRNQAVIVGKYGAPESICDSPLTLVNATFDFIKALRKNGYASSYYSNYGVGLGSDSESESESGSEDDVEQPSWFGSLFNADDNNAKEGINKKKKKHRDDDGKDKPKPNITREFDFVLWTGDNARHDNDMQALPRTWAEIQQLNRVAVGYMKETLGDLPIIPSIGNNDIYPHNTIEFTDKLPNPTLDFYAEIWKDWIPKDQLAIWKRIGCFQREVVPGIIAVSLNTLYLYNSNEKVKDCSLSNATHVSAGAEVYKWLHEEVLKPARARNQKVIASGHVPPNSKTYFLGCYTEYARLAQEFADVWIGGVYGHMNFDHFYFAIPEAVHWRANPRHISANEDGGVIYNDEEDDILKTFCSDPSLYLPTLGSHPYLEYILKQHTLISNTTRFTQPPTGLVLVAPSVVPAFNPSLRIYSYDGERKSLTGYEQWYVNLTDYNLKVHHPAVGTTDKNEEIPKWEIEYDAVIEYDMTEGFGNNGWWDVAKKIARGVICSVDNSGNDLNAVGSCKKEVDVKEKFVRNFFVGTGKK